MWYHRKWALAQAEPCGMVRFALAVIADHANEEHDCWIGLDRLAAELGLKDTGTARRHCIKLAEAGIVDITERWRDDGTQSSNLYHLNVTDRELEPFMDPKFDPYKNLQRAGRLERRKMVREKQEAAREVRRTLEGDAEPLPDTPGEGYREGYEEAVDPCNIAGVTPADLHGSPLQDCMGHPGKVAGVTPAGLQGHEQSLETSAERPVGETGESSRASAPPDLRIAGDGSADGLPAGVGAKTAPTEQLMPEPIPTAPRRTKPPRWTSEQHDERLCERDLIQAVVDPLVGERDLKGALVLMKGAFAALAGADPGSWLEALRCTNDALKTTRRHDVDLDRQVDFDTHLLIEMLNVRPLESWPVGALVPELASNLSTSATVTRA